MSEAAKEAQAIMDQAQCIHDADSVAEAVDNLADCITADFKTSNPVIITVMNGGLIPAGMILPKLNFPLQQDYLHATRYGENTSGGVLNWKARPQTNLENRVVLVIDDILDEGLTLQSILEYCREQGAKQVVSCVLVEKIHDRKTGLQHADYVGLQVEDVYVFGCGMDYKSYLRNLPGIYAINN